MRRTSNPNTTQLCSEWLRDDQVKRHAWRGIDVIPLPHPSGASTWYHVEPGKTLTKKALALIGKHAAWKQIRG